MKQLMMIVITGLMAVSVQAGEKEKVKGQTKEKYVVQAKKAAEGKGKTFVQEKCEKYFDKLDANKDGILTKEERKAGRKKQKAE